MTTPLFPLLFLIPPMLFAICTISLPPPPLGATVAAITLLATYRAATLTIRTIASPSLSLTRPLNIRLPLTLPLPTLTPRSEILGNFVAATSLLIIAAGQALHSIQHVIEAALMHPTNQPHTSPTTTSSLGPILTAALASTAALELLILLLPGAAAAAAVRGERGQPRLVERWSSARGSRRVALLLVTARVLFADGTEEAVYDALLSLVVHLLVGLEAYEAARDAGRILLQVTPKCREAAISSALRALPTLPGVLENVSEVHKGSEADSSSSSSAHFWTKSPGVFVGTLVVRARADADEARVLASVQQLFEPLVSDLTVEVRKGDIGSRLTSSRGTFASAQDHGHSHAHDYGGQDHGHSHAHDHGASLPSAPVSSFSQGVSIDLDHGHSHSSDYSHVHSHDHGHDEGAFSAEHPPAVASSPYGGAIAMPTSSVVGGATAPGLAHRSFAKDM